MKNQLSSLYDGAKNKFLILNRAPEEFEKSKNWITKTCLQYQIDGILFLEEKREFFQWHFYNSDGSTAEMCGNAARCAACFVKEEMGIQLPVQFMTGAGLVKGFLKGHEYRVQMPKAETLNPKLKVSWFPGQEVFYFTNTGVPHLVWDLTLKTQNLFADKNQYLETIKKLRFTNELGPAGANITLVAQTETHQFAVTYERGVEGFTEACGTGAVAAAIYFKDQNKKDVQFIDMPGGKLEIAFERDFIFLSGPVHKIKSVLLEKI